MAKKAQNKVIIAKKNNGSTIHSIWETGRNQGLKIMYK